MPHFDANAPSLPSAPRFKGIEPETRPVFNAVLAGIGVVIVCVMLWRVFGGRLSPTVGGNRVLGPWPLDPARVATRAELIQAFEYLSLLHCGEPARAWHHRAIADCLGGNEAGRRDAAAQLAELYEQARYAPTSGDEPDWSAARPAGRVGGGRMMRAAMVATLFVVVVAGPGFARSKPKPYCEDTHAFRAILNALRTHPPPEGNDILDEPWKRILIVFGRTEILDSLQGRLHSFIKDGGAILIATDRRSSDELLQEIGVRVSGATVATDPRAGVAYRNMPECPFVWEFGRPAGSNRPPSGFLYRGMGTEPRVASNLPSEIAECKNILPLATLSARGHSVDLQWGGMRNRIRGQSLFAVMGNPVTWGKGRLLVMADQSIFINQMMLQPDNDNFTFVVNTVRWLVDAGGGQRRDTVVFLDDGELQTEFNATLDYPAPTMPPLIPLADEIAVGLERDNAFNESLLEMTGGMSPIMRVVAGSLTVILLLFGLYRFMQGRYRPEPRLPSLLGRLDSPTAGVPALERRHQAVIAQGNLAEAGAN